MTKQGLALPEQGWWVCGAALGLASWPVVTLGCGVQSMDSKKAHRRPASRARPSRATASSATSHHIPG